MGRSRADKARAIRRVEADGAVPMHLLAELAGADERSLIRWARDGRSEVFLDAICRGANWFSSVPAVARFLAELARQEEEDAEAAATGALHQPGGSGPARRPPAVPLRPSSPPGRPAAGGGGGGRVAS